MSGPLRLTRYTTAMLPAHHPRRLVFDETTGRPAYSDANGNWADLAPIPSNATQSGTFTPTLTNTANLTSSAALQCQYMRVGSVVTVSGGVTLTPTLGATLTTLGISLPVASALALAQNLGGAANSSGVASASAAVFGDVSNKRATLQMISVGTGAETLYFSFTYLVI